MAGPKHISMEGYQWGHFGAIMADTIVFLIIAYLAYKIKSRISVSVSNNSQKIKGFNPVYSLNWIIGLSLVFALVTLLGLIPIFKDYDEINIS